MYFVLSIHLSLSLDRLSLTAPHTTTVQLADIRTSQAFSKTSSQQGQRDTKVDRSNDIVKPNLVGAELGRVIQQGRDALDPKVDRKEFARLIGENENVVKAYENGTALRNQGILLKMERRLHVKLTGSNIGAPIEEKPRKKDAAAKKDVKK